MMPVHKAWLIRVLTEIADDPEMSGNLRFKGGTCAAMLGWLDRFSVDLDFDVTAGANEKLLRQKFHAIFKKFDLEIKQESKKALEFWVKYEAPANLRNTIKIDALNWQVKANKYRPQYLPEIDRFMICQTIETMFANKLVAVWDRWRRSKSIAARDIYDIHHFYLQNFRYLPEIIEERTGMPVEKYLAWLRGFIGKQITEKLIDEDLNTLVPPEQFKKIRRTLKQETLSFLKVVK